MSDDKERLAAWMMQQGFATGHGDTTEELLDDLSWQVAEIKAQRDELLEALEYAIRQVPEFATVPGISAAIAKAKGEHTDE